MARWKESSPRQQHQDPETPPPPFQQLVSTTPTTTSPFPSVPSDSSPSPSPSPSDLSSPSIPQTLVRRNLPGEGEFLRRPITPLNLGSLPSFPFPDSSRRRGRRDEGEDGLEEVRQDEDNREREERAPGVDGADLDPVNPTTTPSSPLPLRYWPRFPPSPLSPDILLSPLRRPRTAFPFPSPDLRHHHIRPQTSPHLTQTPPPPPSRAVSSPSGSTYLSPWRIGARNPGFFSSGNGAVSPANTDGASRALWFAAAATSSSTASPSALSRSWSELDNRGERDARTSSHLELGSPLAVRDWTGRDAQDEVD